MKLTITILSLITLFYIPTYVLSQESIKNKTENELNKLRKIVCKNGGFESNTYAFTGKDGVLLIDAGFTGSAEWLKTQIDSLQFGKAKMLINTHLHGDHIGANKLFAQDETLIIAHKNVRKRLKSFYGKIRNISNESLPGLTFNDSLTLFFNDEVIKLYHFPGHSDGDIVVYFSKSKALIMGDLLITIGFPSVEVNVGGNIKQYLKTLKTILETFPKDTRFLPGHGNEYNHSEFKNYYQMAVKTTNIIEKGIKEGKSVEDLRKENVLSNWNVYQSGGSTANYWIGAVALSLTKQKPIPSIAEPLLETLEKKEAKEAMLQYKKLKREHFNDYQFAENALNILGYYLLGKKRIKDAIEIFELNVEEYPKAFNVYDSLGEAYMINGNKELAIKNYKKSLKLNPDNLNAVEMIKVLKAE